MKQLAIPDLNALLRDRESFAVRAIELGLRFERLPQSFPDMFLAFLRVRSLQFAEKNRTGISLGRDGLMRGMRHAFTSMDLGLESTADGDVDRALDLLSAGDFTSMYREGYEIAHDRLEGMRSQSAIIFRREELALLPEFNSRLRSWSRIIPETFVARDGDHQSIDIDPRKHYPEFEDVHGRIEFVCGLPRLALRSALETHVTGFDTLLRRLIVAVALPMQTLDVKKRELDQLRTRYFSQRLMDPVVRNRALGEIDAHVGRSVSCHRVRAQILRESEGIITELEASSDDKDRFVSVIREDLSLLTEKVMKFALDDIASHERSETARPKERGIKPVSRSEIERAARLYNTNKEASEALGIHPRSFARSCRKFGILTPYARRRQARRAKAG